MKTVEISEDTLRGVFLILCDMPTDHSTDEVYQAAIPIMNKAHQDIIDMGNARRYDSRGADL